MAESTETAGAINSRWVVEECVEFVRRSGARSFQLKQTDRLNRRRELRKQFTHQLCYCPNSILSERHTRPAYMLNINSIGMALLCPKAVAEGMVIHVRLPLLNNRTAWVKGRVIYCMSGVEHHRVGLAFILDDN